MRLDPDDVQPLLAGTVRWEATMASVDLGDREVEVAGDVDLLRSILGACDGRTSMRLLTARYGDEARELLGLLLERGAVVDGEQAWRVLHRQSSVGTALGRPLEAGTLARLERGAYAPPQPLDDGTALAPAPSEALALAWRRRSTRPGTPSSATTFATLSAVLAAAYGVPASADGPRSGTVPSAGALYPLALHVLLRRPLPPVPAGLWWHDPQALSLHRLSTPETEVEALFVPEPACAALLARGEPVVLVSAELGRPSRKYGARAYRYALMEAGAAVQAASLVAAELDLPLRAIGGIDDRAVHRFLGLPDDAVALIALLLGS